MRVVVSDAGPLIGLARFGRLGMLEGVFAQVLIPPAVRDELRVGERRHGSDEFVAAMAGPGWLRVLKPTAPPGSSLDALDAGEAAAISLAVENACPILIDERRGRRVARQLGVEVIGTGRVLIAARERGLIDSVGLVLDELAQAGYCMSDRLRRRILQLAGQ